MNTTQDADEQWCTAFNAAGDQPDLFGEYDRQQEQAEWWREPGTCPACGTTEPNGWLLNNNHGVQRGEPGICGFPPGQHPIYGDQCLAQHLVSNHITSDTRSGDSDALARDMERGRALGLDVEAIHKTALRRD